MTTPELNDEDKIPTRTKIAMKCCERRYIVIHAPALAIQLTKVFLLKVT